MTFFRKSILQGTTDGGSIKDLAASAEGQLRAEICGPTNPFGSIHTESFNPALQGDAVHGINNTVQNITTSLSGSVVASNGLFVCSTGTTIYGFGALQSKRRVRYRPGQGITGRFSALFSTGVANAIIVAGFGHGESGLFFGYNGTSFGVLHSNGGVREIRTLTVSTKSSTAENVTVTLNGVATSVSVTNGASTLTTAYEIANGTYAGWDAVQRGSTVVFVAGSVGSKPGTYSLVATTAVGTFASTTVGVASTDTWVPQTSWNVDKLDGLGPSGITLDPTKGNVYQIKIQYLGFGPMEFQVETVGVTTKHPSFVTVHCIDFTNSRTTPTLSNPSFPFTAAAYSAGSTTNQTVSIGSYAAFVEGTKKLSGNRFTYVNTITSATSGSYTPIFSVRDDIEYKGRASQVVVELISVVAACKHTSPVILYFFKNATLSGTPNFTSYSTTSSTYYDTSATGVTISDNNQLIFSLCLADSGGNVAFAFAEEFNLQPGDVLTVAARTATGNAAYVMCGINTREDQ